MIKVANNIQSMLVKQANKGTRPQVDNPAAAPQYMRILNPTSDQLANYGIYAGGGGLAGAGVGALVNALRGESKLKGALIGALLGAGGGVGVKGIGDYVADEYLLGKASPAIQKVLKATGVADSPGRIYRTYKDKVDAEPDKIDMPLTRKERDIERGWEPGGSRLIRPDWLPSWFPGFGVITDEYAEHFRKLFAPPAD